MASYKVPQDVEADDKLIGPFSFRQFIYLIIVAMAIALAWGLAQIFIGLAIIPLPVILLFGALALPLRKDQPMEIYLAAMVSFVLKPRKRLWDPEGMESTIEITAPKTVEVRRVKDLSEGEAHERLNYLANLVDTQGWSTRGLQPGHNIGINSDVLLEAQGVDDILDTNTSVANNFGQLMEESTRRMHEEARQRMLAATAIPEPTPTTTPAQPIYVQTQQAETAVMDAYSAPQPAAQLTQTQQPVQSTPEPAPVYNPYPNIRQVVVQPLAEEDQAAEVEEVPQVQPQPEVTTKTTEEESEEPKSALTNTSGTAPSTGIIELANNADLSIQTIAREANRLKKKSEEESDEVVISLR